MRKKGIAKDRYRLDGGVRWDSAKEIDSPNAKKARERMIESGKGFSLTDEIVQDFLGGSNAALIQSKAYEKVIDDIKTGNGTRETTGSLAEAARRKMIEREAQNGIVAAENPPDIGRDRANRRAYPTE